MATYRYSEKMTVQRPWLPVDEGIWSAWNTFTTNYEIAAGTTPTGTVSGVLNPIVDVLTSWEVEVSGSRTTDPGTAKATITLTYQYDTTVPKQRDVTVNIYNANNTKVASAKISTNIEEQAILNINIAGGTGVTSASSSKIITSSGFPYTPTAGTSGYATSSSGPIVYSFGTTQTIQVTLASDAAKTINLYEKTHTVDEIISKFTLGPSCDIKYDDLELVDAKHSADWGNNLRTNNGSGYMYDAVDLGSVIYYPSQPYQLGANYIAFPYRNIQAIRKGCMPRSFDCTWASTSNPPSKTIGTKAKVIDYFFQENTKPSGSDTNNMFLVLTKQSVRIGPAADNVWWPALVIYYATYTGSSWTLVNDPQARAYLADDPGSRNVYVKNNSGTTSWICSVITDYNDNPMFQDLGYVPNTFSCVICGGGSGANDIQISPSHSWKPAESDSGYVGGAGGGVGLFSVDIEHAENKQIRVCLGTGGVGGYWDYQSSIVSMCCFGGDGGTSYITEKYGVQTGSWSGYTISGGHLNYTSQADWEIVGGWVDRYSTSNPPNIKLLDEARGGNRNENCTDWWSQELSNVVHEITSDNKLKMNLGQLDYTARQGSSIPAGYTARMNGGASLGWCGRGSDQASSASQTKGDTGRLGCGGGGTPYHKYTQGDNASGGGGAMILFY